MNHDIEKAIAVGGDPKPSTACCSAESHPYRIVDFFAFRGVLFGRVIVEHEPGDVPRLSLLLHDDRWIPVAYNADPIHSSSDRRTALAFSCLLPAGTTGESTAAIALFIQFRREHLNIATPIWERMKEDSFVRSEPVYWELINALPTGARILEIGSRARSGVIRRNLFPRTAEYVGFDIVEGPNVDVVGDAHRLSEYFPPGHFDAAFSVSVWEHLAMPWKVSVELNRVLKIGGVAMINTHQSWPVHEAPWDYFRFSEFAWPTLFNVETGFEIIACGMGNLAVTASALAIQYLQDQNLEWQYGYLSTRCVIRKIAPTTLDWLVDSKTVTAGTYSH